RVPETHVVTRKVCVQVPVCEERTVMQNCYSYRQETCMVSRCVDRGHWECREQYSCCKAFCNCLKGLCHRHDCCYCPPSNCKTVKVWCPCMVTEQCPVTRCVKVCEQRPVKVMVRSCRTEVREQQCTVCSYRCV